MTALTATLTVTAVPGANRRRLEAHREAILIRGVRTAGSERTVLLAEQHPRIRRTCWDFGDHARDCVLSLPRLLFPIVFWRSAWEKAYVFVLKAPFCGPETPIFSMPLPNVFSSGRVCMGSDQELDRLMCAVRAAPGWEAKAHVVLEQFWASHFSNHLINRLRIDGPKIHPALSSLASWERASRQDAGFVERANWEPAGCLQDLTFQD